MRFIIGFILSFLIVCIFVVVCGSITAPRLNDNSSGGVTVLEAVLLPEPAANATPLTRGVISKRDDTMYLPWDLVEEWNQLYIKNNDTTEIGFCLTGYNTTIDGFRPAIVRHTSYDSLGIECALSDIAFIHSHPEHDCRVSYGDIVESQRDPIYATGVICDVNKYVFWRNGSFLKVAIISNRDDGTLQYITLGSNEAFLSN